MPVQAQVGGSIVLSSDERYRGVSLSDGRPSVRAGVSWDGAPGWYVGASAASLAVNGGARRLGVTGYAGYARRRDDGGGWEVGATRSHFGGGSRYDYLEFYAALLAQRFAARLYLSPDYFGSGRASAYAELNGGIDVAGDWRLAAHAGGLRLFGSDSAHRLDGRIGLLRLVGDVEWQLAWTTSGRGLRYPTGRDEQPGRWIASVSLGW